MGLEIFATKTNHRNNDKEIFFKWKGHYNLYTWFQTLNDEKTNTKKILQNEHIPLNINDINDLEKDIIKRNLYKPNPIFVKSDDEHRVNNDVDFIEMAKDLIDEGYKIFVNFTF